MEYNSGLVSLKQSLVNMDAFKKAGDLNCSVEVCFEHALAAMLKDPTLNTRVREVLRSIPIIEMQASVQTPLQSISSTIHRFDPPPYLSLGATYGEYGPFMVRVDVGERLLQAQQVLNQIRPGALLCVFDAYRPLSVQSFMVEWSLKKELKSQGIDWPSYCNNPGLPNHVEIKNRVMQIWAEPNPNPESPPPHSTGAAIDLTLKHSDGSLWDMGAPIDSTGPESQPNYFCAATDTAGKQAHEGRQLLNTCMTEAGFKRLPHEWWHFSYGDQWWALLSALAGADSGKDNTRILAKYGRFESGE